MKRGDPAVIWPRDWLPKEEEGLGDNILVLYVGCLLGGGKDSWMNSGNDLVQDLVMNTRWQLDRPQTIVLVGHGVGGILLKSFTMEVDKVSKVDKANGELQKAICKAFQQNIKGIVFYSVPHATSEEEFATYWKSYRPMPMVFSNFPKQFYQDMVWLSVGFEKSIEQQDINLFAFVPGQKVSVPQSSTYKSTQVPQSSTYKSTQENVCKIEDADYLDKVSQPLDKQHYFYNQLLQLTQNNLCKIEDADYDQVSQPLDQQHDSYKRFLQFIQEALDADELRKAKQKVATSTRTNEIKHVPNQHQKLDVMIRTIMSPRDLKYLTPTDVLGKTSIVCVGGKAMEGGSGEFLFMDVGDMAKVVGVGLNWAKVVVTKEFRVNVMQEDEGEWTKLWCLEHFVPRIITIPNPKQKLVTHPNVAKTDGVDLEANLGPVYVEDDKEENVHACFPLVFELAEHIGLGRKNAMKMKEVSGVESSGSTKGGEVSGAESSGSTKGEEVLGAESSGSTKGGEVSGAESSGSTKSGDVSRAESSGSTKGGEVSKAKSSGSRQEVRRNEEEEGSEDPSRSPPNPLDPSFSVGPQDEEERTLIVNVYPKAGELSIRLKGQIKPPSIGPRLEFKFQKKGECRMIHVEAETQCNFGRMEKENGFGYYQNDITISLSCEDEDPDAAIVTEPHVQKAEYVKKTMTNTSAAIKNAGHQIGCEIGGVAMPHAIHDFPLHAQGTYGYTSSGGTNFTQGSNHDVPFVQLGYYHVNDECIRKELRYNFQYPQHILQQIAATDSSEIKTENTFWSTIVGNWVNLNNKMSPYVFSVERHIVSKEKLRGSEKHVGNPPHTQIQYEVKYDRSTDERSEVRSHIKQSYKVELEVNHAMTHMPQKVNTLQLSESKNILKIENVMEMLPSTPETI
ncbi:hypothetical protein CY35_09G015500 [Sphagnum magellanicum]|nr:hypothetical protein CY35_09G015500 [Sphagnum magellanicum]KAH9551426.1 hypothetical protein CY35_09G015500 [Sphagnum magellanicum]KAH9551427.1 hypothetical protein CY35_09G015500 [Sphagnum magellanicum]